MRIVPRLSSGSIVSPWFCPERKRYKCREGPKALIPGDHRVIRLHRSGSQSQDHVPFHEAQRTVSRPIDRWFRIYKSEFCRETILKMSPVGAIENSPGIYPWETDESRLSAVGTMEISPWEDSIVPTGTQPVFTHLPSTSCWASFAMSLRDIFIVSFSPFRVESIGLND